MLLRTALTRPALFLALAFTMVLPPAVLAAPGDTVQAYTVSPNPAPAGQPFTLSLDGGAFGCSATFARETVTVTDHRIDLSFTATNGVIYNPPVPVNGGPSNPPSGYVCPLMDQSQANPVIVLPQYGPRFSMPALKAGQYQVWASRMLECQFTKPACLIAVMPQYAGVLTVALDGSISYTINPTTTAAGKAFTLNLLSYQFNCGTSYDMLTSSVNGDTISLNFLDHEGLVGIACPAIYAPYGPVFQMAALKAGTYTVMAYRLPACAAQKCAVVPIGVEAGTLTASGDGARDGWFLKDHQVAADKAFSMQMLNNKYGNCQTTFSHQSMTLQNGEIWVSFLVESHPSNVCITDIRPYGPTFDMQAMKAGGYPLRVTELLQCQVTAPFCPVASIIPLPSDTLLVGKATAIRIGGDPALAGYAPAAPSAFFQGARLNLALPAMAGSAAGSEGAWRGEVMTLSGRILQTFNVDARSGGSVGLDAGVRVERGIYLLRLLSPSGETHTLPLVRKD